MKPAHAALSPGGEMQDATDNLGMNDIDRSIVIQNIISKGYPENPQNQPHQPDMSDFATLAPTGNQFHEPPQQHKSLSF